MDATIDMQESLLRAVWPANQRPKFWINGHLSSAALKDPKGLSVNRTYDRPMKDSVDWMTKHFRGVIVSITVPACLGVGAYIKYCPSLSNAYHCEIHESKTSVLLNDTQARILAQSAKLEYEPKGAFLV